MNVLKNIAIGLVVLILVFVGVGFLLPSSAHVERSLQISASAEEIHPHILDFRKWQAWSPWAERDLDMEISYEGPATGVGSIMRWSGEKKNVGSGSRKTIAVEPNRLVRTNLDFGAQGQADAYFKLEPKDGGSRVRWGFDSDLGLNLIGRYFGLLFDRMIGPDYEQGLAKLKSIVESA